MLQPAAQFPASAASPDDLDLDAALAASLAQGYTLIDATPRTGAGGCRIAFLHPKSTDGVLIELTE